MSLNKIRLVYGGLMVIVIVAVIAAAASIAMGAASSSPVSPGSGAPAPIPSASGASIVRVGQLQAVDNLNPFIGIQGIDYEIWHLNYDFLVGFGAKDLAPTPELATSWSVSPDGKTWTFQTRQGVKWQDGVPFTAADVAFTFNYIVQNNLTNLSVYTDGIVSAKATGPNTVQIYTKLPKANMLRMVVPILPEHIWSKVSGKAASSTFQNNPPIIGTGPYQVVEIKQGSYVHLTANESYWGGAPKVHDLYIMTYTNADTMTADLKLGALDAAVNVPPAQFKALATRPGITTNPGESWNFTELGFNCYNSPNSKGNPVLLDPKFRQALNYAVDRQKIVETAFYGYGTVGSTLIVPYSPYHWQPPAAGMYTYDPAKANAMLDAAGYKKGSDGYRTTKQGKPLSLRLMVANDLSQNVVTGKLCAQWFRDIGVKVVLSVVDPGVLVNAQYAYTGKTYTPDFDLFIWMWVQDVDPAFMISIYTPAQIGGWSDCLWTNPEYTKLSDEAATTIDQAKRISIVQHAQELFYNAAPYIIFTYPSRLEAWNSNKWTGWTEAPSNGGAAIYNYNNVDTYKNLAPNINATKSGGAKGVLIAVVVIAAVVIVLLVVLILRRSRARAVDA